MGHSKISGFCSIYSFLSLFARVFGISGNGGRRSTAAKGKLVFCLAFASQSFPFNFIFFILLKPQLGQPREGCFPASSGRRPAVEKLLPAFLNSVSLFFAFCHVKFRIMLSFELRFWMYLDFWSVCALILKSSHWIWVFYGAFGFYGWV